MRIEELVPIEYREQRVLTGRQVAELYGTTSARIKDNFGKNKKHFKEGEHYFKVEGEPLRRLKEQVGEEIIRRLVGGNAELNSCRQDPLGKATSSLILYTAKGCARHCKMLNTETAWKVFGELEQSYFNQSAPVEVASEPENEVEVALLRKEIILLKNQLPRAKSLDLAVVYVLLMSNGSIKIGLTGNLPERIKQIKMETGLEVYNYETTKYLSREDARQIEQLLMDKFAAYNLGGEFFSVNFAQACTALLS